LQAVHAHVDVAREQRLLDLLHEEGLAPELGEGHLGQAVAGGADDHDLGVGAVRAQPRRHLLALHQGEAAAPGAQPHLHSAEPEPRRPKSSEITSVRRRPWPAREESLSATMGAWRTLFTMAWLSASITRRVSSGAPGRRASARSRSARRIASSFSRSEMIVGTTSSCWRRPANFTTSRSSKAWARWASRSRSFRFDSTTARRSSTS